MTLGNYGVIAKSTDGSSWSVAASAKNGSITGYPGETTVLAKKNRLYDIIYADYKFVAVGGGGYIAISSNNVSSWTITKFTNADTAASTTSPSVIIFANGKYITTTSPATSTAT